ncbi:Holliday junction branch migration protein RuvA [Candidatus Microgenomates bacterium]|nr:MAG: Holliday junction branch migration protein RuvA [Candidatus Microgenomates bacterium]
MIGYLEGEVIGRKSDHVLVLVHGVGYKVHVPRSLQVETTSDHIKLFTYTHIREDLMQLFGFATEVESDFFEILLNVSGVGPRTALAIVERGVDEVAHAIEQEDVLFFTGIPRLGSKMAKKIILELQGKMMSGSASFGIPQSQENEQLVETLISMGFSQQQASQAVRTVVKDMPETGDRLKAALKLLDTKR